MTNTEKFNIGAIFKATRKFHGLHQAELAAVVRVTQGTISKIECQLMSVELFLWFRFLKAFNVKDPYCFTNEVVEFDEKVFSSLIKNGSHLAPEFDFKNGDYVCTIGDIYPIYRYLLKDKAELFEKYLTESHIQPEIFQISNHPLPKDFVDSFFAFLEGIKINDETLVFLIPDFKKSSIYEKKSLLDFKKSS